MSNAQKNLKTRTQKSFPGYVFVRSVKNISEYRLKSNNLTVLYFNMPDTGVVTTNITYKAGARDEAAGETGIAHMLEHMLFKPTKQDLKRKIDSSAMKFERETGCILNANTSKDRTTYFFCYPNEHLDTALQIEADRMIDVVLTDKEFLPERGNVLSEFDMYNGNPEFALSVQMVSTAFHSHPYGHETIGYREDIESYTPEKLDRFYKRYYRPDNATMMIIGDVSLETALKKVRANFEKIQNPKSPIVRHDRVEPKQEGQRRIEIIRDTNTNILALGVKHAGFPSEDWFTTAALFAVLTDGPESVLTKALVDTGKVTSIEVELEATSETNLGIIFLTLAPGQKTGAIEEQTLAIIRNLDTKTVKPLLAKVIQRTLTNELFSRASSLGVASELTEYTAAGDWSVYYETESRLKTITVKKIIAMRDNLFTAKQLTIGTFTNGMSN